ncbi:MAG: hypothetical protein AAF557_18270 [Pseudomonadota bacterium]
MTDVLKIAIERRTQLQDEVAKLDDFIRMAETLMNAPGEAPAAPAMPGGMPQAAPDPAVRTSPRRAQEPEAAEAADVPRPSIIRRSANAAG